MDAGDTWSSLYLLNGATTEHEFGVALTANEGGGSWHLAFTRDQRVYYSRRPQDLSETWQPTPDLVNDSSYASHHYPGKGIASNWTTDVPGMAWPELHRPGSCTPMARTWV